MQTPGPPSGLGEQAKPDAQSLACAQPVSQAPAAQVYGEQLVMDMGVQLPAPSHVDTPSSFDPEQPAAAQVFPE